MEKYTSKLLTDFSGGVNLSVSRLLMADNECFTIQNGELEKIGSITKVRGYTQRGADVNTGYNILGAIGANKSTGVQKQIVICDDAASSDAYTYNPITNTWTPHVLSLTSGAKAEFEPFLDGFFMVNFEDATRWNNFTQWYTDTNVTGAAKAKYIKQYHARIYLAYVVTGGTTYPSRITYSNLPDGSPMTLTWDDTTNYFDVATDDGDVIKALEVNSDRLLIFKENSLYRYDDSNLYQVPGAPGTVSQRSVKNIEGWTLYLHSTGVYGYDGATSKLLSRRIKDIIEGISTKNFTNACAYVKGDHYYLYLGDIVNNKVGLTINNCLLDYDISKNAFTWKTLEKDPLIFFEYRDDRSGVTYNDATLTYNDSNTTYNGLISAEQRIYFGDIAGGVYEVDSGRSFDGTDISFLIETKDFYLDYPSNWKLFQKVNVLVNSGKGVMIQYRLDDKDWQTLGKVDKTQTELIFPSAARGQRIRFRISDISSGDRFSFEGLDIYYVIEGLIE
jgi:hypothetical protein